MPDASFPAGVSECDVSRFYKRETSPCWPVSGLMDCDLLEPSQALSCSVARFSKRVDIWRCKPSIHRCGGSAGSNSCEFFRFPLNCGTELRREHQHCYSKPLPKCHCAGNCAHLRWLLHLQKSENIT